MHKSNQALRPASPWQIIILMVLFLTVGIGTAALAAVLIMQGAVRLDGPVGAYLLDKGADRVMRRCIFVIGLIFLGYFLKIAGWRGGRDCGFSADPDRAVSPQWRRQIAWGILIGLATLGGMSLAARLLDIRIITPPADWSVMPYRTFSYLLSGISVGLLEEIICRGILFRVCARLWRIWPAALFSSAIFALAHFLSPTPEAFEGASPAAAVWRVYLDTFANVPRTDAFILRFCNLTLLGVVLCAFLERTGSIWQSIGAHAAWVWVIKFHHFFTDFNPARKPGIWFGTEADFTDSLLATGMMLALLLAGGLRRRIPASAISIRQGGLAWQADPAQAGRLVQWLQRHWQPAAAGPAPFVETSGAGRELKAYDGCRVTALDGLVIKAHWPRRGRPGGWRFSLRPPRARRNFDLARQLGAAGIPTAPALAWSAQWRGGRRRAEYLIAVALDAQPLQDRLARPDLPPAERAALLTAYGRLAAMFHARNYSNRDLKYENVMAGAAPSDLWAVDLDGVHKHWRVSRRRAGRDLFRVGDCLASRGWAGPADARAFFAGYNQASAPRLRRQEFPTRH